MTDVALSTPEPVGSPASVEDGIRIFSESIYGRQIRYVIDPSDYTQKDLAESLADAFLVAVEETSGSANTLSVAIRHFLTFLDNFPHEAGAVLTISSLGRRHVDAWEMSLLSRQREELTDTPYRYVVHLLALLRRIEEDDPGTLRPDLVARLESRTRLSHIRRQGLMALSPDEVRRMRSSAHRQVYRALQALGDGVERAFVPDVAVALHVLLSASTGEPPEVLRRLTVGDVVVSASSTTHSAFRHLDPADRLAAEICADDVESVEVTYFKARAGQRYRVVYSPKEDAAAFRAFRSLLRLGAAARRLGAMDSLWVCFRDEEPWLVDWHSPLAKLRGWIERTVPEMDVPEPCDWRRFRKNVTAAEALAAPARYLRDGRRHSAATFFDHYTNSPVLRAQAGRILVEAISERFDEAVAGPLVVTPDAEDLLREGADVDALPHEQFEQLDRGELDTPMAGCRDPHQSPFTPEGHFCSVSTTGDCFSCPNAIVMRRHLPAAVRLMELTSPERAADLDVWQVRWRPIYETLTQAILPAFSPEDIEQARSSADDVLLDPTLLNDLGDAE